MDIEWLTAVGVLATSACLALSGITLVLVRILHELQQLNALLRGEAEPVEPDASVGYSSRDKSIGD